jgi:YfiR/HmsC-like
MKSLNSIPRTLAALLLTVSLLTVWVMPLLAREPASEDAVKAAMLYNFVQFVRWPDGVASPEQGLVLGILGRDPLQE